MIHIGIDPGLRNLGVVALRCDPYPRIIHANVYTLPFGDNQGADMMNLGRLIASLPHCTGPAVKTLTIENQDFGRRNTTPLCMGLEWGIGSTLASTCPCVTIVPMESKFKFKLWPKAMPGIGIKEKSLNLAKFLIKEYPTLGPLGPRCTEVDHLSDALGMVMSTLKGLELLPPPGVLPESPGQQEEVQHRPQAQQQQQRQERSSSASSTSGRSVSSSPLEGWT